MDVRAFDWDSWNIEHIARHHLRPDEVEAACRSQAMVRRGRDGRYLVYGRTSAGRYVLVVLHATGSGVVRVITARDMTDPERRFYQRRH